MDQLNSAPEPVTEWKLGQISGQFLRFAVVGVSNTLINFAVLNLLSHLTGIKSGPYVVVISVIAFGVALANSYFLNDYWVFRDEGHREGGRKFSLFLLISVIGAGINSLAVYLITTHVGPMFGLSSTIWLNVANLIGTGIALLWNFTGYRTFVFVK